MPVKINILNNIKNILKYFLQCSELLLRAGNIKQNLDLK